MSIEKKVLAPLKQLNDYGCGVYAVMNTMRRYGVLLRQYDFGRFAKTMKTNKIYGTRESAVKRQLIKEGYRVTTTEELHFDTLHLYLKNRGQVILLYVTDMMEGELHYCNIFNFNKTHYFGANFIQNNQTYTHKVTRRWLKKQDIYTVFYITKS